MASDKQEKQAPVPLTFEHKGTTYTGLARPLLDSTDPAVSKKYDVFLDQDIQGTLSFEAENKIVFKECKDPSLTEKLGQVIREWYQKKSG